MTDLKKLGAVLERKHKKTGNKPTNEAKLARVQLSQLRNVLAGEKGYTFVTLEKICHQLGVTIKFFDGDKEIIL